MNKEEQIETLKKHIKFQNEQIKEKDKLITKLSEKVRLQEFEKESQNPQIIDEVDFYY